MPIIVFPYKTLFYNTGLVKLEFEPDAKISATTSSFIYNSPFKTGCTDNVVASSGAYKANNGVYPMKYRGIENPWGNTSTLMSCLIINDDDVYVIKDAQKISGNVTEAILKENTTLLSYKIAFTNPAGSTSGYVKKLGYDENHPTFRVPIELGASTNTYYCDSYFVGGGIRIPSVGGTYSSKSGSAGLFYFAFATLPIYNSNQSSRLSYGG